MAELRASLIRPEPAPTLPSIERLAPPPPLNLLAAEIESRTRPGEVVVDLFGRGGWVGRTAIARLRRSYTFESSALTGLLAEVVLRPPDVRHFDAAVASLGSSPHGQGTLRQALNDLFASRCPTCGRAVVVDEFIWDGEADSPFRKSYRCVTCRGQTGSGEVRAAATDAADAGRVRQGELSPEARRALLERFPVPEGDWDTPAQLLALYTPRTLIAIAAILQRLDEDLRAAPVEAALRLALLHALLPASKLHSYPGRVAALRIVHGRVRSPGERQWRERNPWLLFEDGCRLVRGFVQRIEGMSGGHVLARFGEDLEALGEGAANVVLRDGNVLLRNAARDGLAAGAGDARRDARVGPTAGDAVGRETGERSGPRVRLVLTQPPLRWSTETLSFAYLATSLLLGRDAASELPLAPLFDQPPRSEWAWEAAALRRGLGAVRPMLAPGARAVVLLEPGGAEAMVAAALGGVGAGYRLGAALLAEAEELMGGTLEFQLPERHDVEFQPPAGRDGDAARGAQEAALGMRGAAAAGSARGGSPRDAGSGWSPRAAPIPTGGPPPEGPDGGEPFDLAAVERAITEAAVAMLRARGEPARYERLLGEVMVALDQAGHLRRLVGTRTYHDTEQRAEARGLLGDVSERSGVSASPTEATPEPPEVHGTPPDAASDARRGLNDAPADQALSGRRASGVPPDAPPGSPRLLDMPAWESRGADHVAMLLELIDGELRRGSHPRLQEVEPGRWWLRDREDIEGAVAPLSDRLEWATFSLLSTTGGISEPAFYERIASMFRGHDMPDESLVRACLESYQTRASTSELLRTGDELQARHVEHTELIGRLVDYGHRLGLRCWVNPHEQRRLWEGLALGERLSDVERRAYLPLVARGPVEALEAMDCIWYVRGKATFLFEVEWTAMLAEPVLRHGARIPQEESVVRFLVVVPERVELIRFKLERSPLLRSALEEGNWHFLKSNHLRALVAQEEADLARLEPFLGLDPPIERAGVQLPLFS